jgi:mono/diheme cytochrome c family protein
VWIFSPGPRRTIPQHTDFARTPSFQRVMNWSADRDEEEDFELNVRAVSGGAGLIVLPGTSTPDPTVNNFSPLPSGGRNQLKVRGVNAWDAIEAFVQFGIRAPISAVSAAEPDVVAGRALFASANCQLCHGGPLWTSSRLNFIPPPGPGTVKNGQLIDQLRDVGTFDPAAFNEVRQSGVPAHGADGFQPGSLLSLFAFPRTFLHNGAETSLAGVLENVTHRSAGTAGVDTLSNAADRAKLVRFLLSIDKGTPIFP